MAKSFWTKLWYEVLDDPKMGRLSDHQWRRFFEFIMVAGECDNGGYLPSVADLAWRMRTAEDDILASLQSLSAEPFNLITLTPDGDWLITNFAKRQDADSNADRQRRYRERKHKAAYYGNDLRNDNVTKGNTDKDKDKEEEGAKNPPPAPTPFGDYGLRVFNKVTGMFSIPDTEKVIPALEGLYYQYGKDEDKLITYLKPFYQAWIARKNKNGRTYSKTRCGWLYEWAVAGEIPSAGGGEPTFSEVHV